MKDGVIFQSAENERKLTGPGYYNLNTDTLSKPSFNIRASQGKSSVNLSASKPRNPSTPRMRGGASSSNLSRDNSIGNLENQNNGADTSPNPGSSFKANPGSSQRPRSSTAPRQRVAGSYSTPLKQ